MLKIVVSLCATAFLAAASLLHADEAVTERLQNLSVTISTGDTQGSGVLINRNGTSYVLTAGHVVEDMRTTKAILDGDTPKVHVFYSPVTVIQHVYEDGTDVGRMEVTSDILSYSSAEYGDDVALLKLRKSIFASASATFYLDQRVIVVGTPLFHVGSMRGEFGFNSVTTGVLSQHGKRLRDKTFEQISCVIFPGSSGGGIFLPDGRYVGMAVRSSGPGFNYMTGMRRLQQWAKRHHADFILDPSIKGTEADILREVGEVVVEKTEPGISSTQVEHKPSTAQLDQ